MRASLIALLTALAVVALVGPAAAAAETVTFVNAETEEPLEVGSEINGFSNNTLVYSGSTKFECPTIEFSGELTGSGENSATVEAEPAAFTCFLNAGGKYPWFKFSDFEMTPMEFFADGSVDYPLDFTVKILYGNTCSSDNSTSDAAWNPFGLLSFKNNLSLAEGEGCPSNMTMDGSFTLTDGEGQPVGIRVE